MRARSAPRRRRRCGPLFALSGWSSFLLCRLLDNLLVGGQGLGPEALELGAKRLQAVGVEPVDAARSERPGGDQPRLLQDLEVLGDGGPADRQLAGELADGLRMRGEAL